MKWETDTYPSFGKQGAYYRQYKKAEEFETLARLHLGMIMQEFGTKWGHNNEKISELHAGDIEQKVNLTAEVKIDSDTEEGFLDLIILSIEDFGLAGESINRIGTLLEELSSKTQGNTEEVSKLSQPITPNEARPLINRQADTYENFAQRAEVELPILSTKFRSAIVAYTKSAQLLMDFETKDSDQIKQAIDVMSTFKSAITNAQQSTRNLKDAVQSLPRMTTRLNHAKRHLVDVLDKILEEYEAEENLTTEAEKSLWMFYEKLMAPINNCLHRCTQG